MKLSSILIKSYQFRSVNNLPRTPVPDQRASDSASTGSTMTSYRPTAQDTQTDSTGQRRLADSVPKASVTIAIRFDSRFLGGY